MLGSPNFVRFVSDGDGSETPLAGPKGSKVIESVFLKYFEDVSLPVSATAFDGRSDYGPFIEVGIPAGGLFTGAEGIKTPDEAAMYGGTAGLPHAKAVGPLKAIQADLSEQLIVQPSRLWACVGVIH